MIRYLAVIPARGGSKGIPLKNVYPICNKPLLEYTLDMLNDFILSYPDIKLDIAISTDDERIVGTAKAYDFCSIIKRPDSISGDMASTESALLHAVDVMNNQNSHSYDAIITLQATSPLRTKETLFECIRQFESDIKEFDALLTLSVDFADFWIKTDKKRFERLYPTAPRRRQERRPLYSENSCVYITVLEALKETNSVLGYNANGFIISSAEAMDINNYFDICLVEAILLQRSGNIFKVEEATPTMTISATEIDIENAQ